MKRDPELQKFLDSFAKKVFGRTQSEAHKKKICVECGEPADVFRDELSRKEYAISGLCQKCQDKIWNGRGEEK